MAVTFPTDLEIARKARLLPMTEVAANMGIGPHLLEPYGYDVAKIRLEAIDELADRPKAKYVVVSAITPTPLGEGKTTTTVGLGQALTRIGRPATVAIRQPSMGPTFGIKGGAAGGGYSQVVPMELLNLHLTGDNHAVTAAHNLLAAMIDNHVHQNDDFFHVDRHSITWRRVLDVSDRVLRNIIVGLGQREDGVIRQTGFDITAASEVMAVLALSTSLQDMRRRLGRIVIGNTTDGKPITAEELHAAGAMTVIMREAIKPNLLQTLENTPVLVHAGPFGNIAHGNSAVIVTTVRALKVHSGRFKVVAGRPLPPEMIKENPDDVCAGADNLRKQVENIRMHGVTPVIAINTFPTDHASEHAAIRELADEIGVRSAVCHHFTEGGKGAVELAEAVAEAAAEPNSFHFLYPDDASLKEKIETVAKRVYGASGVEYDLHATRQIDSYERNGFGRLPVCIAKTHLSISSDPTLKGAPTGWVLPVREVRASVGAGFIYPICGDMRTMPGLPSTPAAARIDIDDRGEIVGLS